MSLFRRGGRGVQYLDIPIPSLHVMTASKAKLAVNIFTSPVAVHRTSGVGRTDTAPPCQKKGALAMTKCTPGNDRRRVQFSVRLPDERGIPKETAVAAGNTTNTHYAQLTAILAVLSLALVVSKTLLPRLRLIDDMLNRAQVRRVVQKTEPGPDGMVARMTRVEDPNSPTSLPRLPSVHVKSLT
ncbi:unnamed protein product [Clonostachys byssicola]|uniref:Uncharacterized protein n=1 Tax=Clonostachys byssicola TaxID=160290 RepID=A0A9N9UHX9_9HYPO|nr:unnamed protein product [Clonostachys byssicola]